MTEPRRTKLIDSGDGIGPEVTQAVVRILEARARSRVGALCRGLPRPLRFTASTFPVALYESIERNRVALKGPVTTPIAADSRAST